MNIDESIIKYYLKNVYFITGTAYAGKSTMVERLAEKYGMIHCGENYHSRVSELIATQDVFPDTCYFKTMNSWQEFLNREPEEYERWYLDGQYEIAQFEVAELIRISEKRKVIVDTNIPVDLLQKISDYTRVAVMLSPQSMSVDYFFERKDPEKQFLLDQIRKADDPEKTMKNFRECLARINSIGHYNEFMNSGFYTIVRKSVEEDTSEEVLKKLSKHFGLY